MFDKEPYKNKSTWRKIWYFLWEDNSLLSWVVNIIVAFILIKFLVYPGLGLLLGGTTHPVVAVVSGSMHHDGSFDQWWAQQKDYYEAFGITREQMESFPYKNGFNKGDIMVLYKRKPDKIKIGDILVFQSGRPDPIIHRVIRKWRYNGEWYFQTKGDHNAVSIQYPSLDETNISEDQIVGVAIIRIPYLGWIKLGALKLMQLAHIIK